MLDALQILRNNQPIVARTYEEMRDMLAYLDSLGILWGDRSRPEPELNEEALRNELYPRYVISHEPYPRRQKILHGFAGSMSVASGYAWATIAASLVSLEDTANVLTRGDGVVLRNYEDLLALMSWLSGKGFAWIGNKDLMSYPVHEAIQASSLPIAVIVNHMYTAAAVNSRQCPRLTWGTVDDIRGAFKARLYYMWQRAASKPKFSF